MSAARRPRPQRVQEGEPVHHRHGEVEQDQLRRSRAPPVERLRAVAGLQHRPAVALQHGAQPLARVGVVVHHQHVALGVAEPVHDRLELVPSTGFGEVVGRAERRAKPVFVDERHHDDRDPGEVRIRLQRAQHRPAVHLRHHHVEQDGARLQRPRHLEPGAAIRRGARRRNPAARGSGVSRSRCAASSSMTRTSSARAAVSMPAPARSSAPSAAPLRHDRPAAACVKVVPSP